MAELLTSAQMRAVEQAAIESGSVTGMALMERAGRGVVEAIEAWFAGRGEEQGGAAPAADGGSPGIFAAKRNAVVLCGPGNNGGDGFVIARLLFARGWEVEVFLAGDAETLPPDARCNYERWCGIGAVQPLTRAGCDPSVRSVALWVDALFGTGLTRPVEGEAAAVLRQMARRTGALIAVDAPSGLCMDSGRVLQKGAGAAGAYVPQADLTVTFQARKRGHVLGDGPAYCGPVRVVDLGIGAELAQMARFGDIEAQHEVARMVDAPAMCRRVGGAGPVLGKEEWQHKFDHGHAVVIAGPAGKGGAARLAARAALRVGAGLVTVVAPDEAQGEMAAQLNAIMLARRCDLSELLADQRVRSVCIGPGLGRDDDARALLAGVIAALSGRKTPARLVLDADALSLIAEDGDLRAATRAGSRGDWIITPHMGEFARLAPEASARLGGVATAGPAYSRVDAARALARDLDCITVLKGADTVIAPPCAPVQIHAAHRDMAAPWLATAGSGDVLAGLIAGLAARLPDAGDAPGPAVWLHAAAARSFGPGLIAEDLPEQIPAVLRSLQAADQTGVETSSNPSA